MAEALTTRVSLFGRLVDGVHRHFLPRHSFRARLDSAPERPAIHKGEGFFCFTDVPTPTGSHVLTVEARGYRSRTSTHAAGLGGATELVGVGDDELHVTATSSGQAKVDFAEIPFVAAIPAGALVLGESGFTQTLKDPLGGAKVKFAVLNGPGPPAGEVLRIVRSSSLLMRPGPTYAFPPGTTRIAVRVVEDPAGELPVAEARVRLTGVDGSAVATRTVAGVGVKLVVLGGVAAHLGSAADVELRTDARGDAVLFDLHGRFQAGVSLVVDKPGHAPSTLNVAPLVFGGRVHRTIHLPRT